MKSDNEILGYLRYAFLFAHPDEEIYTCNFMADLIREGKAVDIIYVTSGDYHGEEVGKIREKELLEATKLIGIPQSNIHLLRFPERELMYQLKDACIRVSEQIKKLGSDCIIGHDFEGGHNGHDAVSFCAASMAEKLGIPFYAFPAYHSWPEKRVFNQFISPREATYTKELNENEAKLKRSVMLVHKTQKEFMNMMSDVNSKHICFGREVLRKVELPVDYTKPPTDPVGYEFPGSKVRFEDFKKAILSAD